MTTFNGVRIEAEKRRRLSGEVVSIRKLVKSDFISYYTLKEATGIDFSISDALALSMGIQEDQLVINAKEL